MILLHFMCSYLDYLKIPISPNTKYVHVCRTKSCRTVMKRTSSVLNEIGTSISVSSSPPRFPPIARSFTAASHGLPNDGTYRDDCSKFDMAANNLNLFKQRSGRLNYLTNLNVSCTSPVPSKSDLIMAQTESTSTDSADDDSGFGQYYVISESEVEGVIDLAKEQKEGLSSSSKCILSPIFDDNIVNSCDNGVLLDISRSDSDDRTTESEENDRDIFIHE